MGASRLLGGLPVRRWSHPDSLALQLLPAKRKPETSVLIEMERRRECDAYTPPWKPHAASSTASNKQAVIDAVDMSARLSKTFNWLVDQAPENDSIGDGRAFMRSATAQPPGSCGGTLAAALDQGPASGSSRPKVADND